MEKPLDGARGPDCCMQKGAREKEGAARPLFLFLPFTRCLPEPRAGREAVHEQGQKVAPEPVKRALLCVSE